VTTPSCSQEKQIKAWLDGELDPPRAEAIASHVRSCTVCSAAVEESRRIVNRLRALMAVPAPRLGAVLEAVFRRAEEEGRTIRSLQRVALAAAAVFVCAVGFLFFSADGAQPGDAGRDNVMAVVFSDLGPGEDY
jgi:anti-sigma factor RsiW